MNIADFIPLGMKNAITREELRKLTGLNDRQIREMISQKRREIPIISLDNKGYFIPTKEEKPLVEKWVNQEKHRAKSIFWSMAGAKKFIEGGNINA